ncbi:MAG: hypothetical protein HN726_04030 [Candidatus Magasanikbacteria bacterium]|jgi:hypothetical protein|nr:hypothetical protein [Candidatus Magasanikbacteria bacterium]MBT4221160.1 hypothetical protein [Candidatus Magasanikbacteria bacterium]MBT4350270.1 hypothetical protein [Candidatus Magasanikbacteria bacterium]MBT4541696.1 hypothetical protein [Candidatus Magasanikbacteria bacterium]MBT6253327.1 hypothetical protein [Candidatus Magasanikbacteria bacterium]
MLEHLFGSKTRLKLLGIFFRDPSRAWYVRELAREAEVQINGVRREIDLLLKSSLLQVTTPPVDIKESDAGAKLRKYYILNTESILYPEIQALLTKGKLMEQNMFVEEVKKKAGDVTLFLVTGRFTGDTDVQSDLLLVGKIKERVMTKIISTYEKEFGFDIRYTIMTNQEFKDRRNVMDKFIYSLFDGDHVLVVNNMKDE